ncbi:hypothetical protein DPMN_008156 [Dreissena polymorpha]|uniref:Cat eye syndrome critical region protein 2 n=1 Tax=Dreissena polymorpha TaxID=45954 RepID=A0A9D4MXJ5_DREPO|nr:hypothetical protein DPMN_008156 [Dreissena polymorpha]
MDELQSWWEVPSIAHFCSLFRSAFNLTDFDIEDLERELINSEEEEGSEFIRDILCRLLNGCYSRKDVTSENYDIYVKDIIKYKWDGSSSPILEKSEFKQLTLREKVELLLAICEFRLDTEDVVEQLKGFEGDSMRVEPLGKDKEGSSYWYFYGTRLYKEDPLPKKELPKEEKKAQEKKHREELKQKKKEERKQKKTNKNKLKEAKQVESKRTTKSVEEDDCNVRRSGRIRKKKVVLKESSSSESKTSSSEEEESDSGDDQPVEEKTPAKGRGRGRTTKEDGEGKTPRGDKTPSGQKENTGRGRRTSSTKDRDVCAEATPKKTPGTQRGRRRGKVETPPPTPQHYDSDTENEDIDSGHESAASEGSKLSARSEVSLTPQVVQGPSRRPTVNLSLRRDLSKPSPEEEELEGTDDLPKKQDDEEEDNDLTNVKDEDPDKTDSKDEHDAVMLNGNEETNAKEQSGISKKIEIETSTDIDAVKPKSDISEQKSNTPDSKRVEYCDSIGKEIRTEAMECEDQIKCNVKTEQNMDVTSDREKPDDKFSKTEDLDSENGTDNLEFQFKSADDSKTETQTYHKQKSKIKTEIEQEVNELEKEPCFSKEGRQLRSAFKPKPDENGETETEDKESESKTLAEMRQKVLSPGPAKEPEVSKSTTRWHVVCTTLDDWINLAEWYKESPVRCEKALSKIIREDFLPVLPEIIEAREKERQKRLLLEQEVRRSDRITAKMREKIEQERILAEAMIEEEKARIKVEEERRLKEEQLKLEEENKQREERRKAREGKE